MSSKKKVIIVIIFVVLLAGIGVFYYDYSTRQFFRGIGDWSKESTNKVVTTCDGKYKNGNVEIDVHNYDSNDVLEVKVINPRGEVIYSFSVNANEDKNYTNKIKAMKGDYIVEFTKNNDTSMYDYEIRYDMDNK